MVYWEAGLRESVHVFMRVCAHTHEHAHALEVEVWDEAREAGKGQDNKDLCVVLRRLGLHIRGMQ